MADEGGFNSTTIKFGSTVAEVGLRSLSVGSSAAAVDLSATDSTTKEYATGLPDYTITCTLLGTTSITVGEVGALTIDWNHSGDSDWGTLTAAICTDVSTEGSMDGEITSNLTFRPSAIAVAT